MENVDDVAHRPNPTNNSLVRDVALADWVYHRNANDQGFALSDISDTHIILNLQQLTTALNSSGLTIFQEKFVYNRNSGFAASLVVDEQRNVTIVVRGTDIGNASSAEISNQLMRSAANNDQPTAGASLDALSPAPR